MDRANDWGIGLIINYATNSQFVCLRYVGTKIEFWFRYSGTAAYDVNGTLELDLTVA